MICRPSKLAGYMHCPGMAILEKFIPESQPNPGMLEGIRAHHIAGKCLKARIWEVDKMALKRTPEEIIENVQLYLDAIHERTPRDESQFEAHTEIKVDGDWIYKGFSGTPDHHVIKIYGGTWSIFDLKYGKGVMVDPIENPQLAAYAIMILGENPPLECCKRLELIIFQPRATYGDQLKIWEIEDVSLFHSEWSNKIKDIIEKVESETEIYNPGVGCRDHFCNCTHICPAIKELAYNSAIAVFKDDQITMPNPETFGPDDMAKFLLFESVYSKWAKTCRSKCLEFMESGGNIPGYKLVMSKTNRKLKSEKETDLEKIFGDEAFDYKPKGIADLEKLFKSKPDLDFNDFVFTPDGKPTIAPENDKRPAISLIRQAKKIFR